MRLHAVPAGATSGFMCMRARTCVYVSTCVCMYVDLSVCLSVCMYLCIYVCMYACLCFFMSFLFTKDQRDQRLTFDASHPRHLLSPSLSLSCSLTYPLLFLTVIPHVVEFFFSPRPQLLHGDETEDTNNHLSASFSVSLSLCTFFDSDACSLLFGCIFALEVKSRVGGNDAASTKTTDRIFRFCFLVFSYFFLLLLLRIFDCARVQESAYLTFPRCDFRR